MKQPSPLPPPFVLQLSPMLRSHPPSPCLDPWTSDIQNYLNRIEAQANDKVQLHTLCGHYYHRLAVLWDVPARVLPLIFAPIVVIVKYASTSECGSISASDYISTLTLMITGVISNLHGYFKYGIRSNTHNLYSGKYNDIVTDIQSELVKSPRFRTSADSFLMYIKTKHDNLLFGEPVIPAIYPN